jgi:hypothetical protein
MNITRNNYEEYFLLYADNEIPDTERKTVEQFILDNPDLKPELDIFLSLKFTTDTDIVFENKELLKRHTASTINIENFESYQLLFLDNELPDELTGEFHSFNASHPDAQANMDLLARTKLEADTQIIYPDKNALLSENIDRRRAIPMFPYWMRIAAAAVIILAISLNSFNPFESEQSSIAIADVVKPEILNPNNKSTATAETNGFSTSPDVEIQQPSIESVEKVNQTIPASTIQPNRSINSTEIATSVSDKNFITAAEKLTPMKQLNSVKDQTLYADVAISSNKPSQQIINSSSVTSSLDETYNPQSTASNNHFINAVDDESTNKAFRGLFRRATRYFEKSTSINATDGQDRLLIAGLAINLK